MKMYKKIIAVLALIVMVGVFVAAVCCGIHNRTAAPEIKVITITKGNETHEYIEYRPAGEGWHIGGHWYGCEYCLEKYD